MLRKLVSSVGHRDTGRQCLHTSAANPRAQILDGKKIAADVREHVRQEVDAWVAKGNRAPSLKAILVGVDPPSHTYVRNKTIAAKKTGIDGETIHLDENISEKELLDLVHKFNRSPDVDGILVQLPLPPHINETLICEAISPSKDVDGFHVVNQGRLLRKQPTLLPATPYGVMELIRRTGVKTSGKTATLIGRSRNVGLPAAMLLLDEGNATTTICHSRTTPDQMAAALRQADIVIAAVGRPNTVTGENVKPGAVVIDVGITRVGDKLVGDVDFESVSKVAGFLTPVPGGVGPMTVAMLMKNTLIAARKEIHYGELNQ